MVTFDCSGRVSWQDVLHPCRPWHLKIYCRRKACQRPLTASTSIYRWRKRLRSVPRLLNVSSNKSPVIPVSGYRLVTLNFHRLKPNPRALELPSLNFNIIAGPILEGDPTAKRLLQRTTLRLSWDRRLKLRFNTHPSNPKHPSFP